MLREDFVAGIASLQQFNFSYDILIYPQQLPSAIELVAKFPKQRFVLDHIGKPLIRSGVISPWDGADQDNCDKLECALQIVWSGDGSGLEELA